MIGFHAIWLRTASIRMKTRAVHNARSGSVANGSGAASPASSSRLSSVASAPATSASVATSASTASSSNCAASSAGANASTSPATSAGVNNHSRIVRAPRASGEGSERTAGFGGRPDYIKKPMTISAKNVAPSIRAAAMIMPVWTLPATSGWRLIASTAMPPILPMPRPAPWRDQQALRPIIAGRLNLTDRVLKR